MTDRNDEIRPRDDDRTTDEKVADRASTLEQTFSMSPETAHATVRDNLASGTRKPASDEVDEERVARAQEQNADQE